YMQLAAFLLGFLLFANIALAFTIIFLERKNVSSTWAWLMVLFFIPILGFFLYLLFGRKLSKHIFTWDTKSRLGVEREVQKQIEVLKQDKLPYKQEILKEYKDLYFLYLKHNDAIYSQNNDVVLFTDRYEKFNTFLDVLEQVDVNFNMMYFIILLYQLR